MLGLPRSPYAKINIHVGAHYNDKPMAVGNFCKNFERLSPAVQSRLTVENDDKPSLYSTRELVEDVYSRIGIPVVHDLHHHLFCDGGQTNAEALAMAVTTWGDVKPVVHYSQSRPVEQNDNTIRANAILIHTGYLIPSDDIDVMLECAQRTGTVQDAATAARRERSGCSWVTYCCPLGATIPGDDDRVGAVVGSMSAKTLLFYLVTANPVLLDKSASLDVRPQGGGIMSH